MITNLALVIGVALTAWLAFNPRLLKSAAWRATVTPLASIIGSGFLVAGPILADAAGSRAWLAMAALCAAGWLYGAVIRHNILHLEPRLASLGRFEKWLERASELMLALSYFVSVAYYLNLFAAFGLRIIGVTDQTMIRAVASGAILTVGLIGNRGGLRALERLEVGAVGLKLSVIGGLLLALAVAAIAAMTQKTLIFSAGEASQTEAIRIVLGLIILVQGFETSRFLGSEYSAELRVRTMRWAQIISTAIYLLFVLMVTHLFRDGLQGAGAETGIIDMLKPLGWAAAPLLIAAALASQSSAAIADMNGAAGLIAEVGGKRITVPLGNLLTAGAALAVTWLGDIFQIITYASKAFVAYYGLQAVQAARLAWLEKRYASAAAFALGVLLSLAVLLLAEPAKA